MKKTSPSRPAPSPKRQAKPKVVHKKRYNDPVFPDALCDFMLTRWEKKKPRLPARVAGLKYFTARREALSRRFPHDLLIVPTGHEKVRANDTNFPFRPGSDFYYLTGNLEPDGVLVLEPQRKGGHLPILWVEPNPGRSDTTFFTDRVKGELWVGPRLGIEQSAHRFGIACCRPLADLAAYLTQTCAKTPCRVVRDHDALVEQKIPSHPSQLPRDRELMTVLSEMRLLKDPHEVAALKAACDSTKRGFEDVIVRLAEAHSEREVEGVFNLRARMEGNAVGYNTIAASGAHACVLHWSHNHGELGPKDLLLLDAGVEGNELYTADVTRTLPIGGKFSRAQAEIYDLVFEAQRAGFAEVRPGKDFMAANTAAMRVLTHGLVRLGILHDAEDALRPEHQFFRRYTLHNVSHMLGLDVHDCAQARAQAYRFGRLEPGMVLTVEPGLYFQHDDLSVPKAYRGIGVRIEDDVLVTRDGMTILSEMPRERRDVEAWMAQIWRRQTSRRR